jgi:hypothetical protein
VLRINRPHLEAFAMLRRMQLLMSVIESRRHAAFRDHWQESARTQLRGLARILSACQ